MTHGSFVSFLFPHAHTTTTACHSQQILKFEYLYIYKKKIEHHHQNDMCTRQPSCTSFINHQPSLLSNCHSQFHTQMPYLQLTDGAAIAVQPKDVKGAIAHTNKAGVVRRMFVVNEPFTQATTNRYVHTNIHTYIQMRFGLGFCLFLLLRENIWPFKQLDGHDYKCKCR